MEKMAVEIDDGSVDLRRVAKLYQALGSGVSWPVYAGMENAHVPQCDGKLLVSCLRIDSSQQKDLALVTYGTIPRTVQTVRVHLDMTDRHRDKIRGMKWK